jgi:hypothetical protein
VCCGNPDEPGRYDELAAEGRREGLMARAFTTVPGSVLRIGDHGEASNDVPCEVPEEVAQELETTMPNEFRIERGEPKAAPKLTAEELKKASAGKGKE